MLTAKDLTNRDVSEVARADWLRQKPQGSWT
jgi:hypothetical protein